MVKTDILVRALIIAFGENAVRVYKENHVQVRNISVGSGWHDIWVSHDDPFFLLRLHGKRNTYSSSYHKEIISRIDIYQESKLTVRDLNQALKIGECFQHAHMVLLDHQLDNAIFVDGGWKDGKAKIAAVLVSSDGDMDIKVRVVDCKTSSDTEIRAVLLGYELRDDKDIPIFTDCQCVLGHDLVSHIDNLHWVPRNRNKTADRLSSMRRSVLNESKIIRY